MQTLSETCPEEYCVFAAAAQSSIFNLKSQCEVLT